MSKMSRIDEILSDLEVPSKVAIEKVEDTTLTLLLKYDDEPFEIAGHEFIPPRPYYIERNHNFFHPEFTAASLLAHELHPEHHHHHHHHQHHSHRHHALSKISATFSADSGINAKNEAEKRKLNETLDIISALLPPRDFKDGKGKCFRRDVSSLRANPSDVKVLTEEVEKRLSERCAREVGYCPIRRGIFSDCFDEILRQVILENSSMGVVLGRIRDELRMTIGCYRRLNQSMDAYSSRKGLQGEGAGAELNRLTTENEEDQGNINKELITLRRTHAKLLLDFKKKELHCIQQNEADIKRRVDELDFFTNISTQLHKQMEQVRANAKEFL